MAMKRLLQLMAEKKASDIFISVGSPISIKINGVIDAGQPADRWTRTRSAQIVYEMLTERQIREFEENLELNISYADRRARQLPRQRLPAEGRPPAIVVRYIPGEIPTLDDLACRRCSRKWSWRSAA